MQSSDKTTMMSAETPLVTPLEGASAPAAVAPPVVAAPVIDVKVHCCGEVRRFALPADATLADVKARVALFAEAAPVPSAPAAPSAPAPAPVPELELAWEDEDEDKVALRTEEDWRCCLAHADDGLVRLHVRRSASIPAPCMAAAAMAGECFRKAHAMCREKCAAIHARHGAAAGCCRRLPGTVCRTAGTVAAIAMLPCAAHCAISAVGHVMHAALPLVAACAIGKFAHSQLRGCCQRQGPCAQGPCSQGPCPCPCGPAAPAAAAAPAAPAASPAPEQPCGCAHDDCACRHRGPAAPGAFPAGAFPPNMPLPPWMAAMMGRRTWW